MTLRISTEDQMVLKCARLHLEPRDRRDLDRLAQSKKLSWPKVVYKAKWHRLAAIMFRHLRHPDFADAVPPEVMETLQSVYFRNGLRNRLLQADLNKTLGVLQREGIPVIALKGMALIESVYPDVSLRPMADIDLLVPEELAETAQTRVAELGYAPVANLEDQERTRLNHRHLPKLVDPDGHVKFEVHTHVVTRDSPFRFDIADFLNRAQAATVAGVEIKVLAPEHLLIHLAVHFFLDRRFRSLGALGQLCDIAEALRHYQDIIHWPTLEEEVIAKGLRGPVYCALSLAERLFEGPAPGEFLQRIRPEGFDPSAAELFLKHRVLDNRRVIATQWVKPGDSYKLSNVLAGIGRRILPGKDYLRRHRNSQVAPQARAADAGVRSYRSLLLGRLTEAGGLVGQYLANPLAVWREAMVDRWIHSVSARSRLPSPPGGNSLSLAETDTHS